MRRDPRNLRSSDPRNLRSSDPRNDVLVLMVETGLPAGHTATDSPKNAMLSLIFLLFTYLGPGMIKTYLTVRTGNAWVHLWACHALAPHTPVDTPHMVDVFQIR